MARKKKPKSRIKIGSEHEKEYELMLIKEGWLTHKTQMARGWEKNKDIFNMFDILAFKDDRIKLSQVRTTNLSSCVDYIREWAIENAHNIPDNVEIEVCLRKYATKRKVARWRIYIISKDQNVPVQHYDRNCLSSVELENIERGE